jgi:hypothetical protein
MYIPICVILHKRAEENEALEEFTLQITVFA